MDGLLAVCHATRKGGYMGSQWPNHTRASAPLESFVAFCGFSSSFHGRARICYREFVLGYAVASHASKGKTVDYVLFSDSAARAATNSRQW